MSGQQIVVFVAIVPHCCLSNYEYKNWKNILKNMFKENEQNIRRQNCHTWIEEKRNILGWQNLIKI